MTTLKKLLSLALVFALCASGSAFSKKRKKPKHTKPKKCCPCPPPPFVPPALIVGTWLFNENVSTIGSFSVLSAHSDGTLSTHRSLAIFQPVPADFPTGNLTTVDKGIWKERATTIFQVINVSVVNIVTTGIPEDLQGVIDFARAKSELVLRISEDGDSMTITGTITLFEVDDLTLTKPLLNPNTGLPFVSNIVANGSRLKFSLLDLP